MPVTKKFLHVKVAELIPYENNPRINEPAAIDRLMDGVNADGIKRTD